MKGIFIQLMDLTVDNLVSIIYTDNDKVDLDNLRDLWTMYAESVEEEIDAVDFCNWLNNNQHLLLVPAKFEEISVYQLYTD